MAGEQNVDTAKQAYDAFSAGDAEAAMARIADDVEWITPGNSAISGTVHGKQEVGALWAQLAEKGFTTSPQHWFSDEDRVVVLTQSPLVASRRTRQTCSPIATASWSSSRRRETPPYWSSCSAPSSAQTGPVPSSVVLGGVAVGAPRHASCVLVNPPIAHEQGERHRSRH